jgi:hypothetical protein
MAIGWIQILMNVTVDLTLSNNERTNYPLTNFEKPHNISKIKYKRKQQ